MSIGQFMPMGVAEIDPFVPAYETILPNNSPSSYANRMVRILIPASRLIKTGTGIKLRLRPLSTGAATVLQSVFIGKKASAQFYYYFLSGSAKQVFFDGAPGVTIPAGTETRLSDEVNYVLNSTDDVLISIGFSNVTQQARTSGSATGLTTVFFDNSGGVGSGNTTSSSNSANTSVTFEALLVKE